MGLGDLGAVDGRTAALGVMGPRQYMTGKFVARYSLGAAIDNAGSMCSPAPTSPVDPGGGVDHEMVE